MSRHTYLCPVKTARWQGVLIGWTSFLVIALLDMAVLS